MRHCFGIALMSIAFVASQVHAQVGENAPEEALPSWSPWTMTASEIQSTGAVRFSELIRMMPALETWSSDRYTHRIVGMGLGGLHPDPIDITLDGLSLPAFLLDRVLTESLPVSPGDLDELTFTPGLTMAGPARKTNGTIALRTPMRSGWHLSGAFAVINETGDPGPAKHTDARANNVDRSGPATWVRTGWGNKRWMIQAGVNTDLHHLTDERISGRVRGTYAEDVQPVITQFAPFVRIRHEGDGLRFQAMGGQSRRKDFIYHESAGREWPARLRREWAASLLEKNSSFALMSFRADASRISLSERPSFIELPSPLLIEDASVEGSLEKRLSGIAFRLAVGARRWMIDQEGKHFEQFTPTASTEISRTGQTWSSKVFVQLSRLAVDAWQPNTYSWLANASVTNSGVKGSISLRLAGTQGHFPEPGHLMTWNRAEVSLGDWMPTRAVPASSSAPRSLEFGLLGRRLLSGSWHGWAHAHIRLFEGHTLADRVIDQRFGIGPLLPEWQWSSGHSGWLFSRAAGIERLEPGDITWRAFFQFYHVSSQGDDAFFRHQTGFPRHRLQVMASDTRPGGVRWMTRLGYASAWTWPEYREPACRVMPADIIAEITIGKTLFSGVADALVSVLNIPDRPLGNHPAGVEEQLAIRLTLSVAPVSRSQDK